MVTLYLMGEKGLSVLKGVLCCKSIISQVIGAQDKNVQNDYYHDIKTLCNESGLSFYDRKDNFVANTAYSLAIGWRWIIPTSDDSKLIVLHDSLLPKYRGFAPLVNMLINHEPIIGVTALHANGEYDRGDIIAQKSIEINYPIRIHDAINQISKLYVDLVLSVLNQIQLGIELNATKQDESVASYSLWRDEDDYAIDWSRDAEYIQQFIYSVGFPYKGASSFIEDLKYRVLDCEIRSDVKVENRCPGKVIFMEDGCPIVVCGKGLLKITQLEAEEGVSVLPLDKFRIRFK